VVVYPSLRIPGNPGIYTLLVSLYRYIFKLWALAQELYAMRVSQAGKIHIGKIPGRKLGDFYEK